MCPVRFCQVLPGGKGAHASVGPLGRKTGSTPADIRERPCPLFGSALRSREAQQSKEEKNKRNKTHQDTVRVFYASNREQRVTGSEPGCF
jgi:hypothetical protein